MTAILPEDSIGAFVPHGRQIKAATSAGPLNGLTFAVKDLFDVAGMGTGGGSPEWLGDHLTVAADAPTVATLLNAGADMVGKTVCDEFFYSLTGANAHYGTPQNVAAPGRLPGGSSSGSAAAVAGGLCDFALGSDTGGSVRVPAAFCGLYGLRPTYGRVDLGGAMAMAPRFDTGGWFTRDAELFAKVGRLLLIGDAVDGRIESLAVADDAFDQAEPAVAAALRSELENYLAAGKLPAPTTLQLAPDGFADRAEAFRIVQAYQVWQTHGAWITAHQPNLGPGIKDRVAFAATVTDEAYQSASATCDQVRDRVRSLVPRGTVVVLPTAPCIAPPADSTDDDMLAFRTRAMALTSTGGISGSPQLTVPVATVDGCPVGLSFMAWAGGDVVMLDIAPHLAS